jgi:uncharacterized glyoxalase superfamily protein PhnB
MNMSETVKPIPEGQHSLTPHIIVSNGSEAIEFYKKAFGAEEVGRMAGADGKIMHAELKIGDSHLYLCDEFEGIAMSPKSVGGTSVTLHLYVEKADDVFESAVSAGAEIAMPLSDAFWGDRYGQVVDPFGHRWSIATHIKDLTAEEIMKAGEAAFSQGSC